MAKILIIDDNPQIRRLLVEILASAGHEIFEVEDGEEGLRLIQIHQPALVITDILMPQTDGLEVIRELRRGAPQIPTIAISGGHAMYLRIAKRLGASATLGKPFRPMDLVRAVDELLAS
jgi:CheY-like chemotaxis protein